MDPGPFFTVREMGSYLFFLLAITPKNKIFLSLLFQNALRGETGARKKNLSKHLICGKTAKTYLFWDNLMYHYKYLAPLYGKKIEFKVNAKYLHTSLIIIYNYFTRGSQDQFFRHNYSMEPVIK